MDLDDPLSLYRVVTIGDSAVGKTSIINKLVNGTFDSHEQSTIGAMFVLHVEEVEKTRVEMQIWDTAGQEKFRSLGPIYYRNAAAGIVVFDLTSQASFENLNQWVEAFTSITGSNVVIAIVGNKSDLTESRQVSSEIAQQWADSHEFLYFETSALTGAGLNELFHRVGVELAKKNVQEQQAVLISPEPSKTESGCKC